MADDAEFDVPTQESIHTDLQALFRGAVRIALETVLEDEIRRLVGAGRYQRLGDRRGHRNGTYVRSLVTTVGGIDVTVPRSRDASAAGVLGRYQRRTRSTPRSSSPMSPGSRRGWSSQDSVDSSWLLSLLRREADVHQAERWPNPGHVRVHQGPSRRLQRADDVSRARRGS